jgi:hypothetical protein
MCIHGDRDTPLALGKVLSLLTASELSKNILEVDKTFFQEKSLRSDVMLSEVR